MTRYVISERTKQRLEALLERAESLRPLKPGPQRAPREAGESVGFFARLDSAAEDGGTRKFKYNFVEVMRMGDGSWEDRPGGRTGQLVNLLEQNNPDCGPAASGVDNTSPNYPAGFKLLSIGDNGANKPIVRAFAGRDADGVRFYWCQVMSTDFGPCEGTNPCP